ncbi:MAG: IPT/TIG domain-containing protein [Cystobacterineae bacterium]|nr:IPT/TIG domain-containing protein [Cystobacterineae bacterium]
MDVAERQRFVVYGVSMLLSLAFWACGPEKDDDDNPELRVDLASLHFGVSANQTKSFHIFSNTDWSLSTNGADWLSVEPSSGNGNAEVRVTVLQANTGSTERSAQVLITAENLQETVAITQSAPGLGPELRVDRTSLDFDAEAGSATLILQSNTPWSASCSENWCSLDMASGSGNRTVTVSVSANTSADDRYATVEITAEGLEPLTVSIMQRAFNSELSVNPQSLHFASGDTASNNFNVSSNMAWSVRCTQDWCTVSEELTQGSHNGTVRVTVQRNDGTTERSADVIVATTGNANERMVRITQAPIMPTISSFSPTQTGYGAEMTIYGSHFSDVRAENVVRLGSVEVPAGNITFASPTTIRLTVPSSSLCRVGTTTPCTGRVQVTVNRKTVTSTGTFTYVLTGTVSTFAGNGTSGLVDDAMAAARFRYPKGIAIDPLYGHLYVADSANNSIRRVTTAGVVSTFVLGTGGLNVPSGVNIVSMSALYVVDKYSHRIRRLTPSSICSSMPGSVASIWNCILPSISTIVGGGSNGYTSGFADSSGTNALFSYPSDIAIDSEGNLYVTDTQNHCIRRVSLTNAVTTLAGNCRNAGFADGTGAVARFNEPHGITIDSAGNLYVTDTVNHRIRRITPGGAVTTIAGSGTAGHLDGTGTAARFYYPSGITRDSAGNLYVADEYNHRIRRVSSAGVVSTIAGTATTGLVNGVGSVARFNRPYGVAVDAAANNLYVTDGDNHAIRRIALER